jgi:glycosyltransferase involved in cell wall biosynthesis
MNAPSVRPPRVLHVVESLDRNAVETWLMRMLRHARATGVSVDWTFYCQLDRPGAFEQEARALGAEVIHSPVPLGEKLAFARALRRTVRNGGYEVLHGHHDLVCALYVLATLGLPIRRVVHVHNADEDVLTPNRLKQALYRAPMRRMALAFAHRIVGISNHTLDTFLAGRRRRPGRDLVHLYGVDPDAFRAVHRDRKTLRTSLGVPDDAVLLLFAGRMVPEKNPLFAVDVLAAMRRRNPKVHGLFVGAGSLEAPVRSRAEELGLTPYLRQLGWRDDVPNLMRECDWFILPRPERPMEGFGLAVVEAQLAGLRLLLSRGIPADPLLSTSRYAQLPLAAGPEAWADAALRLLEGPSPCSAHAIAELARSPMAMDAALAELMAIHR